MADKNTNEYVTTGFAWNRQKQSFYKIRCFKNSKDKCEAIKYLGTQGITFKEIFVTSYGSRGQHCNSSQIEFGKIPEKKKPIIVTGILVTCTKCWQENLKQQ